MRRKVLAGAAIVVALVGGALVARTAFEGEPVAEGRSTDACSGRGTVGLVGLDLETGAQRWTNVIGDDVQNVWSADDSGDPSAAGSTDVFTIDRGGRIRRIEAASGDVTECGGVGRLSKAEIGTPPGIDGAGATVREDIVGVVDAVEPDGTRRWRAEGRNLVGSSPGGVVVSVDPDSADAGEWTGALEAEVRDPATGEVRWTEDISAQSPIITADHLVEVDGTRAVAYRLDDGSQAWSVDVGSNGIRAVADDGRIFVASVDPGRDAVLTAIDEATGEVRWTSTLPEPGRGGKATELGALAGVAVADGTVVVSVGSNEPYRD